LKMCCVTPHPPIMVREVGGRDAREVQASIDAMESLADEIESIGPETLIIMSPHTPIYADAFTVKTAPVLSGSLRMFAAPQVSYTTEPDLELADAVAEAAGIRGVRVEKLGTGPGLDGGDLDHGIMVPIYFLGRKRYPMVCLSMSLLDYRDHYQLGIAMREAVEDLKRKVVFVASGDMSHRLKPGAPAGYSPSGEEFDRQIADIMRSAQYAKLFRLDPVMVDQAGECGLRSIFTLAGAMDGHAVDSSVLSYEGPFGVGYMVARVIPGEPDSKRRLVSL
jgi:MEMO1 family protein